VPDTLWFITVQDCLLGKITQLHNYLGSAISLDYVQQHNYNLHWFVDSMSVSTLPYLVNPADSFAVRVKMLLPVRTPALSFIVDSLHFTTSAGNYHVIIMINPQLLSSVNGQARLSGTGNNYPNPFSTETFIPIELVQRGPVTLEILDVRGIRVRTLVSGVLEPGTMSIRWDGTGNDGRKLPGGIYLYRLITGSSTETKRMILLE
jgi:hypothetical protein